MEKKNKAVPRWIMKHIGEEQQQQNVNKQINMRRRFKTVDGSMNVASGSSRRGDEDEIDFDEEFADDEEAPIMDGDEEDVKEVEEKIKREQRSANVIGIGNQPDNAMEEDDGDEPKIDKEGKKLMKYLRSLEKNVYYDSDDEDENPYASEEESEDEVEEPKIKTEEDGIKKEPQLLSPSMRNSVSLEHPIVKRAKKTFINLVPGMVVLQLAPQNLARFPRDVWNPNAKRRRGDYDSEGQSDTVGTTKKIKISKSKSPSPGLAPSVSPPPSSSRQQSPAPSLPGDESNPNILTEKDVRDIISTRKVGAKELLGILKPKLKKDPNNNARLKALVTKIAKLSDGVLVLKENA
jgi:transcription initiation factor TFIIF subunit alpha